MASLPEANLTNTNLAFANLRMSTMVMADLSEASLAETDLGWANLRLANLSGASLWATNFRMANLSTADLSGVRLDEANLSGWEIEGVTCTHIIQSGKRIDFAPGEFEKRYSWLKYVAEVMLRLPLSDLTLYAGPLIAQAMNQAHGEAAVQFKGVEALADDTTSLKFVVFGEAEKTRQDLANAEQRLNERIDELKQLIAPADDRPPVLTLPDRLQLPGLPWLGVDTKALEIAQTRWYLTLPERLQKLWQIVQAALKP